MTDMSLKLSAYLDGELDAVEAEKIETLLASDPEVQAELDALIEADVMAQEQFEEHLRAPVPLHLAQQIRATEIDVKPAPVRRPIWGSLAAGLAVFVIGGAGGYLLQDRINPPQTAGWLADIADYHAVYASQGRHLVEVGADESDHIQAWLGKTIGTPFTIPDLSDFDLTFEGGRLLVANGKPVAQLMYRLPDGTVIALCLQRSAAPATGAPSFNNRTINGFDFVSWRAGDAAYVVIGPGGQPNLDAIASKAAVDI
ncbi:MAG: anti-sigma factor [Sedimentitalea sp.]